VANASHELRTPLSAIRGAVQTLMTMDLERETAAASRFLQMIERHSSRLEAMVADLLELSRLESPGRRFLPAELRLQKVCEEVQGRWGEALAGKGLGWKLEMGLDCHTVRANAHLLHLVLDNLIENAIKFTDPGGTVTLSCRCDNQGLAITVADTGCGIPKADQERVFERFYQVSSSRSAEGPEKRGTGLGLSIVRHAVAAMGGAVRLESELHRGTQVTVLIPMTAEAAIPSS
jgi:two-component system phosphate regulon sensor histidine kinase PhoR